MSRNDSVEESQHNATNPWNAYYWWVHGWKGLHEAVCAGLRSAHAWYVWVSRRLAQSRRLCERNKCKHCGSDQRASVEESVHLFT